VSGAVEVAGVDQIRAGVDGAWMVASDSASSAVPYMPDMPMAPSPMRPTAGRYCRAEWWRSRCGHGISLRLSQGLRRDRLSEERRSLRSVDPAFGKVEAWTDPKLARFPASPPRATDTGGCRAASGCPTSHSRPTPGRGGAVGGDVHRLLHPAGTVPQPAAVTQVLASLARALRFSSDERDHLYNLCDHAAPNRELTDKHVGPGIMYVLAKLDDTAATVITDLGEALVQNRMHTLLVGDNSNRRGWNRYYAWRWFLEPQSRAIFPEKDWESAGPQTRRGSACHRGAALRRRGLTEFVSRLRSRVWNSSSSGTNTKWRCGLPTPSGSCIRRSA